GGDLRVGEDGRGDVAEPQRADRLTERVPHRDPALHGRDRGQHQHAGAVARGVHAGRRRPRHAVDLDETVRVQLHAGLVQPDAVGPGDHAHGEQAMAAGHGPAVGQGHGDVIAVPADRLRPRPAEHGHAAAAEHVLDQAGRVLVFLREHPVPRGHQRDARAEGLVGAGELGPGDTRTDHDQIAGQFGEVIELPPGQDALAVGLRTRQHPGPAPGGTRDRARVATRIASAWIRSSPAWTVPAPVSRPRAAITLTSSAASRAVMSWDWARARSVIRSYSRAALTVARPPVAMPSRGARFSIVIALKVSMRVLEGTQSVSTQAPPTPSESTTVTSAPSWAATRAAS